MAAPEDRDPSLAQLYLETITVSEYYNDCKPYSRHYWVMHLHMHFSL